MGSRLPNSVSLRLLIGVILAGTISVLDSTVVVPLLGTIGHEFGADSEVSWLVAAYLLASTVTIPLWGRWMDLRGERSPMWVALAVFFVGTIVCIAAPSLDVLILGRALQGIGAGGAFPLGQAILAARCSSEERARLQVYYNIAYGTAAGIGPVIGGALVHVSWRWAFVLILPFIVVVALMLRGQLRVTPASSTHRPFDKTGSVLVTVGLTLLLLGVERTWWWCVALGLIVVAFFVWHSLRRPHGLVPRKLITSKVVMGCSFLGLIIGFIQFSYLTYLPLFSQEFAPNMNSGLVVVPFTVLWMSLGTFTGVWALKVGSKPLMLVAIIFAVLASVLLAVWFTLPALFIAGTFVGAAAGIALIPVMLLVQHAAPLEDIGAATSTMVLLRNFGGAFGTAVTAVVFTATNVTVTMWMLVAVAVIALVPYSMMPNREGEQQIRQARDGSLATG